MTIKYSQILKKNNHSIYLIIGIKNMYHKGKEHNLPKNNFKNCICHVPNINKRKIIIILVTLILV